MFVNNKIFKLFEAEKGDKIDVSKMTNIDDIDNQLNKFDVEDGIDEHDITDGDDIKTDPPADPPVVEEDKDKKTDKDEVEDIKSEESTDSLDKKLDEEEKTDPLVDPDKDKSIEPDKDQLLLTEEFITKMGLGDEEKDYLNKMWVGKPIAEALKSLTHAQKLIGKRKEELFKLPELKTDVKVPDKPKTADEIKLAKDDLIFKNLLAEFPEMPKDPAERKKWLNDLNYEDTERADDFKFKRREIEQDVDSIWKFTADLSQNYPKINSKITQQEVSTITDYIKTLTGIDAKEFGYDFTFDKDGNNAITDELIALADNSEQFDPNVVERYNGIPVLKQGAMSRKFLERELPNIMKKAIAVARKQGFEQKSDKKVAPSLSTAKTSGKEKKELKSDQIKQITDLSQIDSLLDQEEEKDFIK